MSGVRASPPVQNSINMKVINYIKDSFEELNTKMTWISWAEAQKSTVVVAIFTFSKEILPAVLTSVLFT